MTATTASPLTHSRAAGRYGSPAAVIELIAKLLVGLSAGFFFTYQWSVIRGLALVDDITYVETFQAINDTIRNPFFGVVFFGSIPALIAVVVARWSSRRMARFASAAALGFYLVGVGITFGGNVVLNNELAAVTELTAASATAARADFESDWNVLNLVRTLAFVAGFISLLLVGPMARLQDSTGE